MFGSVYAERFIQAVLLATPEVVAAVGARVSQAPAPPLWDHPLATWNMVAPVDLQPIGMPVAAESILFDIELIDNATNANLPSTTDRIEDAAEAMHQALHFKSAVVDGHEVSAMRVGEIPRSTSREPDGRVFRYLGGQYQFFVAPVGP